MKFRKMSSLFLLLTCGCIVLLSGCVAPNSGSSGTNDGHPSNATHTSAASSTTASSILPANCPAAGTTRSANLSTDTSPTQAAVFYLTASGGVQSGIHPLDLLRYDLTTHKAATILSFTGVTIGVKPQIQLSPDKHWLIIMYTWSQNDTNSITTVRLMRTDGTQLQTLTCASSDVGLSAANWLPDGQQVALTKGQYNQQQNAQVYTVDVLNLATGKSQTVLSGDYSPSIWLDDHRLIVNKTTDADGSSFFLFDTNKGSHQKLTDLTSLASFPTWGSFVYGDIAVSSDSSQLFTSSFIQAKSNPDNCQGPTAKGPGTLSTSVIAGGSAHAIYSNQNLAILNIYPVSTHTLLMYIENNTGNLSQNGLWKINTDGTGLTRLTTANDQKCRDLGYSEWLPQIASNNQSYALVQTDSARGYSQSIVVGSLSGGTPTTIATSANIQAKAGFDRFLQLVGMA